MPSDQTMQPFQVTHKATGARYYLLAKAADDAVERLTLVLSDLEGASAWEAVTFERGDLQSGVVLNEAGKRVRTTEA